MEENRVRDLSNLAVLENLQRLFLGMNRIQVRTNEITTRVKPTHPAQYLAPGTYFIFLVIF